MRNDRFEWDDAKAASNLFKHEVSFEDAARAFDDPYALQRWQEHDDEERILLIATSDGRLLAVVYTERGVRFRIISARKATKGEQDDYFAQRS